MNLCYNNIKLHTNYFNRLYTSTCAFLKETVFFFVFFIVLYMLVCMSKILKIKKVKVCKNRCASLPQKTLRLKRLVSCHTFNAVTLWHRRVKHSKIQRSWLPPFDIYGLKVKLSVFHLLQRKGRNNYVWHFPTFAWHPSAPPSLSNH